MNEFLRMDIFFFVTTLTVALFAFFGVFILWRFLRILKNIENISEQVVLESENIRGDLAEVRRDIHRGKGKLKSLFNFFGKVGRRTPKKPVK